MKTLLATIFFVTASFTVGVHSAFAQSAFDPGGMYNPLYIQVQQDPFQRLQQQNTLQENNLKSTYGLSNFYSCSSDTSSRDLSDPHDMTQYLNTVKYCLELKSINESNTRQSTFLRDQQVRQSGTLCNGQYWNACSGGKNFVCPSTGDAYCEVPKIDNQGCQSTYGVNSVSYKGANGTPYCRCSDGYEMNYGNAKCESIKKEPACPYIEKGITFFPSPPPMNDPSWVAPPACTCSAGYEADKSGQACIASTESKVPGCTSARGYSSTSGLSCDGTDVEVLIEMKKKTAVPLERRTILNEQVKKEAKIIHEVAGSISPVSVASGISSTTENNVTGAKDTKPATRTYHKGLIQKGLEWAIGLFGF